MSGIDRTSRWDHFPDGEKLVKCLKYSHDSDGNEFNACHLDPIRMVGVNAQAFDVDFWNQHLVLKA